MQDGMRVWMDGIRDSKLDHGGFPESVVLRLSGNREGASWWYNLVDIMHGKSAGKGFPILPVSIPALRDLLFTWMEFGAALGFDGDKPERDQQTARICSWQSCMYHVMPAPKALMVCKGCRETRYCSAACQKRCG